MLFLAIVLLGADLLRPTARSDLLPDVSYPRLVVYTVYPEVAPSEVERRVTERIEAEAAAVPGVERITSTSRYGREPGDPPLRPGAPTWTSPC